MLYEPFPGNAAVVLSRLGFLEDAQIGELGVRTFDAESGRLSLAMDDGRVVELERAPHPHRDNRYAVSVQSREGTLMGRGFIQIDQDLVDKDSGVTDLLNNHVAHSETEHKVPSAAVPYDEGFDVPAELEVPEDEQHVKEPGAATTELQDSTANPSKESLAKPAFQAQESLAAEPPGSQVLDAQAETIELAEQETGFDSVENAEMVPELVSETHTEPEVSSGLTEASGLKECQAEVAPETQRTGETETEEEPEPAMPAEEARTVLELEATNSSGTTAEMEVNSADEPEEPGFGAQEAATTRQIERSGSETPEELIDAYLDIPKEEGTVTSPAPQEAQQTQPAHIAGENETPREASEVPEAADSSPLSDAEFNLDADAVTLAEVTDNRDTVQPSQQTIAEPVSDVAAKAEPEEEKASATLRSSASGQDRSHYEPLFQVLEDSDAEQFEWVAETGTIQTYEHRETLRYLHLDGVSGLFYDQNRTPISRSAALKRVMPQGTGEPQSVTAVEDPKPLAAKQPEPPKAGSVPTRTKPEADVHADELGLDAFVRKADEPPVREPVKESWRDRFAGFTRTLGLARNQSGRQERAEEKDQEP